MTYTYHIDAVVIVVSAAVVDVVDVAAVVVAVVVGQSTNLRHLLNQINYLNLFYGQPFFSEVCICIIITYTNTMHLLDQWFSTARMYSGTWTWRPFQRDLEHHRKCIKIKYVSIKRHEN